jgi:hypothetical protein
MRSLVIFYFASCYITVHFNSLQSYYLLAWRLYTNLSILYGLLSYSYYLPYRGQRMHEYSSYYFNNQDYISNWSK